MHNLPAGSLAVLVFPSFDLKADFPAEQSGIHRYKMVNCLSSLKNSIRSRVSCDHLDDRVVFIKLIQVTVCQMLSVWFVETYRFIEKKY